MTIDWPAFIKFFGDAELAYVASQAEWDADPHLHAAHYQPQDVLIDGCGNEYLLTKRPGGKCVPEPSGKQWALADVVQVVRLHAAQDGACCVSKLNAPSIGEAIAMLG